MNQNYHWHHWYCTKEWCGARGQGTYDGVAQQSTKHLLKTGHTVRGGRVQWQSKK